MILKEIAHKVAQAFRLAQATDKKLSTGIAAALDAMKFPEIVGCIAGDDTIMAAIKSTDETKVVIDKINEILEG